jgi:hypothetical protein
VEGSCEQRNKLSGYIKYWIVTLKQLFGFIPQKAELFKIKFHTYETRGVETNVSHLWNVQCKEVFFFISESLILKFGSAFTLFLYFIISSYCDMQNHC